MGAAPESVVAQGVVEDKGVVEMTDIHDGIDYEDKVKRKVFITIEHEVKVPRAWNYDLLDYWLNESSHCIGNEVQEIGEMVAKDSEKGLCNICAITTVRVEHWDGDDQAIERTAKEEDNETT
jgi:hypothetical protein